MPLAKRARAGRISVDATAAPSTRPVMKFSVVIATYNRADDLRETLASLRRAASNRPTGKSSSSTTTRPTRHPRCRP